MRLTPTPTYHYPMTDIEQVVVAAMPHVMAVLREFGGDVLVKLQDTASDGVVSVGEKLGRSLLRRLVRARKAQPALEATIVDAATSPSDEDSVAALRRQIRKAITEDYQLRDAFLTLLREGGSPITASGQAFAARDVSGIAGRSVSGIHLGGLGGAAPGAAGGGGGGAIGEGAIGGAGGSVGRIELDGMAGADFGAGGGGGGVLAAGAITFTNHELQRGVVGAGSVPGVDGQPGGESSIGDLLVVAGGRPGLAGGGHRLTSDRLKVSSFLPADAVRGRDGVASILDGAWSWINVLNLPQWQLFNFLAVFEAGNVAVGDYTIRVTLDDPEGKQAGCVAFPLAVETPGDVVRVPVAVSLNVELTFYGIWTATVLSEAGKLAECEIVIRRASA